VVAVKPKRISFTVARPYIRYRILVHYTFTCAFLTPLRFTDITHRCIAYTGDNYRIDKIFDRPSFSSWEGHTVQQTRSRVPIYVYYNIIISTTGKTVKYIISDRLRRAVTLENQLTCIVYNLYIINSKTRDIGTAYRTHEYIYIYIYNIHTYILYRING